MSECLRCRNCAPLEPLPKGDPLRLHRGQWGMLARGLVYCSLPGEISGYKRFRSVESVDYCEHFEPEPDADRIARRFETVRILRAAFDQWPKNFNQRPKRNDAQESHSSHVHRSAFQGTHAEAPAFHFH